MVGTVYGKVYVYIYIYSYNIADVIRHVYFNLHLKLETPKSWLFLKYTGALGGHGWCKSSKPYKASNLKIQEAASCGNWKKPMAKMPKKMGGSASCTKSSNWSQQKFCQPKIYYIYRTHIYIYSIYFLAHDNSIYIYSIYIQYIYNKCIYSKKIYNTHIYIYIGFLWPYAKRTVLLH